MGSAAQSPILSDEAKLFNWRLDQLERLGYATSDAAELALTPIDLHELASLIRAGCQPEIAKAILT